MKNKFIVAAFAFIFDENNKILLCHRRDYDLWTLPGGTMELEESPWECVVREVKEETGLDVEITRLVGIYNKPDKGELVFSFICRAVDGKLTLNEEADKIEYFSIKDIPANISQKQVARIHDALTEKEIVLRNQSGKGSIELIKEGEL